MHGSGLKYVNIIYRVPSRKREHLTDALSHNPQGPAPIEGITESEVHGAGVESAPEGTGIQHSTLADMNRRMTAYYGIWRGKAYQ